MVTVKREKYKCRRSSGKGVFDRADSLVVDGNNPKDNVVFIFWFFLGGTGGQ